MIFTDQLLGFRIYRESTMSNHPPIKTVENYTDAFLTTFGVFLFMVLWMIAAALGYLWVAVTAYGIDLVVKWIGNSRPD